MTGDIRRLRPPGTCLSLRRDRLVPLQVFGKDCAYQPRYQLSILLQFPWMIAEKKTRQAFGNVKIPPRSMPCLIDSYCRGKQIKTKSQEPATIPLLGISFHCFGDRPNNKSVQALSVLFGKRLDLLLFALRHPDLQFVIVLFHIFRYCALLCFRYSHHIISLPVTYCTRL